MQLSCQACGPEMPATDVNLTDEIHPLSQAGKNENRLADLEKSEQTLFLEQEI